MAKGWIRRTTKKVFIIINAIVVLFFLIAALSPYVNPNKFWIHGFLALTTPYLIVLLILFTLFWLITKPIWSLLPIIALLIGWQQVAVVFAWTGNSIFTKRKAENHFRIVNWNIQSFNGLSKDVLAKKMVRDEVAASILKTYPDIICLQEFNNAASENNISLFSNTHPYYFFSKDHQRNDGTYQSGCIIFSKYPIINSGRVEFASEESLIYADLLKGNDTIRIFTTHLQSFKFKKKDYADIEKIKDSDESSFSASLSLIRKMKAAYKKRGDQATLVNIALDRSPYPSIIAGDFNDVPNSFTYFNIKGDKNDAFLQRSFGLGRTFISIAPTLRIDYILLDKQFEVKQFDMVDESLSDHIMLVADIRLKK